MENRVKDYINLLIDSMRKKEAILNKLIIATAKQTECFTDDKMSEDVYDRLFEQKMQCIDELNHLDQGFSLIYDRVKEELKQHKSVYEIEIKALQRLIKSITDKSMQLEKLEMLNKLKFDQYISTQRKKIKEYKVSKKTAATYYKNMMKQSNEAMAYNKTR